MKILNHLLNKKKNEYIINTFVQKVILYEDKATIIFNLLENNQNDIDIKYLSSDLTLMAE